VSNHFCFHVIPLVDILVETIRTSAISTVINGGVDRDRELNPNNLNSPQTIYSVPQVDKTYWVRTVHGYWVSVTRTRQEAA
jgi:hypothetical protein